MSGRWSMWLGALLGIAACGDDSATGDADSAGEAETTEAGADAEGDADAEAETAAEAAADADADTDDGAEPEADADAGVTRPAYNTGTGFFVLDGRLYDAAGVEFHIRGVNKCHYDAEWPGIPKTHANTIRWSTPLWREASLVAGLMQDTIDQRIVPMPAVWYTDGSYDDAGNVTCKDDPGVLELAVDQWVAHAETFKPFERQLLVNIANEWGPASSTVWRDAYLAAVVRLRDAGYLGTLVIDAGGCGQAPDNILDYAQTVFDADPQHNLVFDVHIYGGWANGDPESWQTDLAPGLDALAATGLPILVGEFGPGRNIGPSPTPMTPGEIIQACDERGIGWLAWAWDDPAYDADDNGFALSFNRDYDSSADLTTYGKDVVETPSYGLLYRAVAATVFP